MKLHPLSVPFRAVEGAFRMVWIVFVAGFGIVSAADGVLALVLFGLLVIGGLAAIALWQVAYYRRYEYELTDDTFDIASGVVSRREREIPYGRIQNVSINRNVFQRAAGLAEVRLETAGGGTTEAHLRYVGRDEADRLQDELSERKRRAGESRRDERAAGAPGEREPAELLFSIDARELGVLGLVSLDTRLIPLILFGVWPFFPTLSEWAGRGVAAVVAVPTVIIALYLLSTAVSAAFSVANYYGFRLFRADDELRYERGLLERFEGTIPLEKVQVLTISENVLARAVGYASLLVETAGYSPGETGGSESAVPIARRERVLELARAIEPVDLPEFERPPRRARERYFFRYLGVLAILAGAVYGAGVVLGETYPWQWVFAALPLAPIAAHVKWKHRGYALTDEHLLTRNGFWSRTIKIVPYHRVQTVIDSRTIFQRRRRLATLTVDTAGSQSLVSDDSKAVDVDREVAAQLRETVADRLLESLDERRRTRRRGGSVASADAATSSDGTERTATGVGSEKGAPSSTAARGDEPADRGEEESADPEGVADGDRPGASPDPDGGSNPSDG